MSIPWTIKNIPQTLQYAYTHPKVVTQLTTPPCATFKYTVDQYCKTGNMHFSPKSIREINFQTLSSHDNPANSSKREEVLQTLLWILPFVRFKLLIKVVALGVTEAYSVN